MAVFRIENPPSNLSDADEEIFRIARDAEGEPRPRSEFIGPSKGRLESYIAENSRVFPEARRTVRVYSPPAYDANIEANLLVFQDGLQYLSNLVDIPSVLDGLTASGAMPPTIAVFIEPGDLVGIPGTAPPGQRNVEYDTLSDAYSRLLSSEILPLVEEAYNISADPRRRAICGFSSGGIAAFTVAWHRPDLFGGVISHCGSFANLRGGSVYPSLVRTQETRPIRVFLQSGNNDMDRTVGNWAVANHDMAAALRLMRYDYRFEFGNGGHTLHHAAAVLPQTLKWLWR